MFYVKTKPLFPLSALFLGLSLSHSAWAQSVDLPPSANPGRVQEQLQSPLAPRDSDARKRLDREQISSDAPAGSENVKFILESIEFIGQTNDTLTSIDRSFEGLYGTEISLAKVYDLAAYLTSTYRDKGYILSQVVVPPQTIGNNTVKLRIVEGFLDEIAVLEPADGSFARTDHKRVYDLVEKYVLNSAKQKPFNIKKLERGLLLIDDLKGISARSVLAPSETTRNASSLQITLSRKKVQGAVNFNNYGSRYLGPMQIVGQTQLSSVFGWGESFDVQAAYAPDNDLTKNLVYGSANFSIPLFSPGLRFNTGFSHSDSQPGFILNEFNVVGSATNAFVGLDYAWIRQRDHNLSTDLKLDIQEVNSDNDLDAPDKDNLTVARVGVNFDWQDSLIKPAVTYVRLQLSKGLSWLGASNQGDPDLTRPDANPQATKLNVDVSRFVQVTNKVRLAINAQGQYTSSGLLSAEEFGVGGPYLGRGYDPSEIIGDHGLAGQAEVQYFHDEHGLGTQSLQTFLFLDAGRIWNIDAVNDDEERNSLVSTGFGVRAAWEDGYSADLSIAFPLTRNVQTRGDNSSRVLFSLKKVF